MPNRDVATAVSRWDAGEAGCTRLISGLHRQLDRLQPGDRLEVVARDAGAPIDLFVWCRMTGHAVVTESHPHYVIQKRG